MSLTAHLHIAFCSSPLIAKTHSLVSKICLIDTVIFENTLDRIHNTLIFKCTMQAAYATPRCRTRALAGTIRDYLIRCRVFKGQGTAPHSRSGSCHHHPISEPSPVDHDPVPSLNWFLGPLYKQRSNGATWDKAYGRLS